MKQGHTHTHTFKQIDRNRKETEIDTIKEGKGK